MFRVSEVDGANTYHDWLQVADASLTIQGPMVFECAAYTLAKRFRAIKFSGDRRFSVKITSVRVMQGFAPGDGGGLHVSGGAPVFLTHNNWNSNGAGGSGGAIAVVSGPLTIKGDTFYNNYAANGGAVAMLTERGDAGEGAPLALTIAAGSAQKGAFMWNSAAVTGGALFLSSYSNSSLVVSVASKYTISGNTATAGDGLTSGLGGFAAVEQGPESGAVQLSCKPSCSFSNNDANAGTVVASLRKAATKALKINLGKATKVGEGGDGECPVFGRRQHAAHSRQHQRCVSSSCPGPPAIHLLRMRQSTCTPNKTPPPSQPQPRRPGGVRQGALRRPRWRLHAGGGHAARHPQQVDRRRLERLCLWRCVIITQVTHLLE